MRLHRSMSWLCGTLAVVLTTAALPADAANKVVFVTSVSGSGDLSTWTDAGGQTGLDAADAICRARATAAGLANPGDFVAWLSDSSNDAYCRVHGYSGLKDSNCGQISLPTGAGPWVRTDGFPIGDTIEHLLLPEHAVLVPLNLDEFGIEVTSLSRQYYTNTDTDGRFYSSFTSCGDWMSSASIDVRGGRGVMTSAGWTSGTTVHCSDQHGLLCMEKGAGDPMPDYAVEGAQVFVTSVTNTGDLGSWSAAGSAEGVTAGDAICQTLARDAGVPASWDFRAWLSTYTPVIGVNAIDRFYYDGPWVRIDGVPIASSKADLVDGELFAPINLTETGQYVTFNGTWTGTEVDGTAATNTCDNWEDGTSSFVARGGTANYANDDWTDYSFYACNFTVARLYCFCQEVVLFADGFESGDTSSW